VSDARGCTERTDFRWVTACSLAEHSIGVFDYHKKAENMLTVCQNSTILWLKNTAVVHRYYYII